MIIASTMPCSTPTTTTKRAVATASANSAGLSWRISSQGAQVDHVDCDEKDQRAEHALGKILQGLGEEEQDEGDDGGGGDLRDLALAAGAFDDRGLGGAAVDDEGAAEGCGGVGCGEADDILICVEPLADGAQRRCARLPRSG